MTTLPLMQYAGAHKRELLLRHSCTQCGACCKTDGNVYLYPEDIHRISAAKYVSLNSFVYDYCILVEWEYDGVKYYRIALKKVRGDTINPCIFLHGNLCAIHTIKPLMCQAGPYGWIFVAHDENLSRYIALSPGFNGEHESKSINEANDYFVKTWHAEYWAGRCRTLDECASHYGLDVSILRDLTVSTLANSKAREL